MDAGADTDVILVGEALVNVGDTHGARMLPLAVARA